MSTLREPKPGENVFYYCPDCGNRFSDKKPLLPLIPIKCPKCGKSRCRALGEFRYGILPRKQVFHAAPFKGIYCIFRQNLMIQFLRKTIVIFIITNSHYWILCTLRRICLF